MAEARFYGTIGLLVTFGFWIYYTIWIVVSPMIDREHAIQQYFPDRKWGIVIPIIVGIVFLAATLTFAGIALLEDSKQKE